MTYTLDELKILREIRAIGCDDSVQEEEYATERSFFNYETERFLDWIKKMENKNKISELLTWVGKEVSDDNKPSKDYFYKYY